MKLTAKARFRRGVVFAVEAAIGFLFVVSVILAACLLLKGAGVL